MKITQNIGTKNVFLSFGGRVGGGGGGAGREILRCYSIYFDIVFLGKMKLEIIFIKLLKRVTNVNDYVYLYFIF